MKIEKAKSKTDSFVKLALVFFISLLSFSIGTYVGKKYSDNQHKLAALEPSKGETHEGAERNVASVHGEEAKPKDTEKSESLTDEEIKKLAEEFVADDSNAETQGEAGHGDAGHGEKAAQRETASVNEATKHGEKVETEKAHGETAGHGEAKKEVAQKEAGHDSATKAAMNVIEDKPAANETQKAKKVSAVAETLPKDVAQYSVGKYTIQIASFPTEQEAKKKADELKQKGYSAFFIPAHIQGKSWYRVSVGLFSTEKEAKEYRDEFKEKSKIGTTIIQKIVD